MERPSKRIMQLATESGKISLRDSDLIDAILEYLDEQWEREINEGAKCGGAGN